jgi:dinuclear metal center YbgI/SA1388 family protein
MLTVAAVVEYLERFAPPQLAAEWDNVGLLLGDPKSEVRQIMTCLTVTPETAAEAVAAGAQLIVTHHPILFRPVKRLTSGTIEGRTLLPLARAGVAVYCPHTSFDNTSGGINDKLARRLGLVQPVALRPQAGPEQSKIVVFVPEKDLAAVSDAVFAAGAGNIGQYSQCSFRLMGTGTFFGSDAANPTLGQKGRREEVAEWRLEVICPAARATEVVRALRRAHSYEEPAFDVYPLRPLSTGCGAGRLGRLPAPTVLADLARQVQSALQPSAVQVVGDLNRRVEIVAIVCGAGSDFLSDAVHAGADVLLTGEVRFHDYLTAQGHGLSLVLPGHFATERFAVEELAENLQVQFPAVKVWAAQTERDPINWVACRTAAPDGAE